MDKSLGHLTHLGDLILVFFLSFLDVTCHQFNVLYIKSEQGERRYQLP